MNQKVRDIYQEYQYELLKIGMKLSDSPEEFNSLEAFEILRLKIEKLELLIDLYAFLIASQAQRR